MGLSLPSELDFLKWVVGSDWPEADEDGLRRCAAGLGCGRPERLADLTPEAASSGARVIAAVEGEVAESFDELWRSLVEDGGYLPALIAACDELARACDATALEVEYAKYQFMLALVALAISIAVMAAMAWAGGVSTAGIPVAIAATQVTVRLIAMRLLQAIAIGVVSNVAVDALAQLTQTFVVIARTGTRRRPGARLRTGPCSARSVAVCSSPVVASRPISWAPGTARSGAVGISGAVGGVAAPLAHGETPTGTDFLMALTSGVAGGLGPDLVHGRPHLPDLSRLADVDRVGVDLGALADDLVRSADPTRPRTAGAGVYRTEMSGGPRADGSGRYGSWIGAALRTEGSSTSHHRRSGASRTVRRRRPPMCSGRPPNRSTRTQRGWPEPRRSTTSRRRGRASFSTGLGPDPQAPVDRGTSEPRAMGSDRGTPPVSRVDLLAHTRRGRPLAARRRPRPGLGPLGGRWARAGMSAGTAPPHPATPAPAGRGVSSVPPAVTGSGHAGPAPRPDAGDVGPDGSVGDRPSLRPRGTLTPDQARVADALVQRARAAEPRITASVAEIAQAAGGRLLGDTNRLKSADSLQRKLAEKLAGDVPLREAMATMKDSVRYSIGMPDAAYTAGVETAIRHLVEQGFRPADFRSRWDGSGTGGLFTTWSDPHTGQLFEVQFHTDASYHATHATAPSLVGLRLPADPGDVTIVPDHPISVPDGATGIRLPEDTPALDPHLDPLTAVVEEPGGDSASRDDVDDWELADDEVLELVYDTLLVTDAGLAFYAVDDDIREFATAVHPTDGFVTIDLHGAPDSFEIDGFLLSPEQFAGALRHLRDQGLLELPPGAGVKLMSCDTAVGGPASAAATLARELGVVVVAPDQPVWTTRSGEEIVSSSTLVDGRWAPTDPPDGDWHAFDANGDEIPLEAGSGADNPSSRAGDAADGRRDVVGDRRWDDNARRASEGTASDGMRSSWANSEWPIGPDPRPSAADQLRADRNIAHADLVHRSTSVGDMVRSADSLGELFARGVRPDEVAHNLDGATLARLTPGLAPAVRAELQALLDDPRMLDALRRSWDESADGGNQILAETLLRQLFEGSALVRVMNSNEVLMRSLTSRPSTMSNLMRHPRAVTALAQVVAEVSHHGVATILAAPRGGPGSTPLATWQRRIVDQLRPPKQEPRQPGFDHRRRQDSAYVERYVRDLYGHARIAQVELDSIAAVGRRTVHRVIPLAVGAEGLAPRHGQDRTVER